MSPDVTEAVARLQADLRRATNISRSTVLEDALHYLLEDPHKAGAPEQLIERAKARAHSKRSRRRKLFQQYAEAQLLVSDPQDTFTTVSVEALHAVEKLAPPDQNILRLACVGDGGRGVGLGLGIPLNDASKRLSRARHRARTLWNLAA